LIFRRELIGIILPVDAASAAASLCGLGAIDEQIADFFDVDVATLNRWKLQHPEFCASIAAAKSLPDDQVEQSLFRRAKWV
jgi:hypothetical protein